MPKYPGISPYDNEKGTLGTAKKRWEKLYVKEIESDTVSGMEAQIDYLATTAENSVANAVAAKNAAVDAKAAAETAAETAATAAAGIQSVVETDVDNTLSIPGVAADAKVTGDWLNAIAKPVTGSTETPGPCDEFLQYIEDAEHRLLFGIKRDGSVTWQKGIPQHVKDAMTPVMENDEYLYAIVDPDEHVLFAIKKDGTVDWQKGTPKHVVEACNPTMENDEYLYLIKDAEDKVLFGIKKDGSVYWQKGLPEWLAERINQDSIESEEFIQLTQDSEGKLIEGITADGTKKFMTPVKFVGGMQLSASDVENIETALRKNGSSTFDYTKYTRTNIISYRYAGLNVLYLNGDMEGISKENKVNMNYRYGSESGTCTLKWQGASTLAFPKKNFTIAKMTPSLDLGWGEQKKYVLKAEFAEFSHARNNVNAKLWGQIVKSRVPANARLSALPNGGAIDGFPIMLVINDKYQGTYNFNIPKDPWMLDMGGSPTEAMITAETSSLTTQFKATVSKEDMLAAKYWELEYIPDEESPDWAINSFNRMLQACIDSTGANYRETLENYLDIESAIDYYIFVCLIGGYDDVSHNYIMCTYDGDKWFFNAYDLDLTMGNTHWGTLFNSPNSGTTFRSSQGSNRVFHLIYQYDTSALKARYAELRANIMSEANVLNMYSNYMNEIPKALLDEEVKMWPTTPGTNMSNFQQIANWYRLRVQTLDNEIDSL